MEKTMTTRRNFTIGATAAGLLAAPAIARAQTQKWRMVTSWPKRLPGPGMSAERVAERIRSLSGGRLDITVHAAGEMVPAFEVLDAVGNGVADMGHTASFYWQGKMPAASFFTTVPFGLTPGEHVAWIEAGGGQGLWDELYAPFGVKPFMGGNTGVCMGGWFRREVKSLADLRGLKLRTLGLGGEVYRRLGVTPQTTPPAEILISLQSGVIDGAEFVGPGTDIALGLYRVAPFYYYPGFNKPNGTGECIISLKAWNALSDELKAVVVHACATEANYALAEMERLNAAARRVSGRPDHRCAQAGERCPRRTGGTQHDDRQGACIICCFPRTDGNLVAGFDRVGVAGEGMRPAHQLIIAVPVGLLARARQYARNSSVTARRLHNRPDLPGHEFEFAVAEVFRFCVPA
jgi:TRAP-type mannitol/chloroaromatic compound transport system substrate-binding protein